MSDVNWTKEQEAAIFTRDKNILVSAAAGSGKTAVLTQRIIEILKESENIDITSMLILTFTKSAANEMKIRIQKQLHNYLNTNIQNKHIQNQISLVGQSPISTMHSFCIDLIRENFQVLDIDPNFKMGNPSLISIIKDEAIQELFNEKYETEDKNFLKLVDIYSKRNDDKNLISIIYHIHNFIQSKKEPINWLYEQADKYNIDLDCIEENEYISLLKDEILTKSMQIKQTIQKALYISQSSKLPYTVTLFEDLNNIEDLEKMLFKSYDLFVEKMADFKYPRLKSIKKSEDVDMYTADFIKNMRNDHIKKYGFDELKKYNIDAKTYARQMQKFYPIILSLCDMVKEFDDLYKNKKLENNIFDFNDLEHFAIKILEDEAASSKVRQKYKHIFYDEYQDSNEVQDSIIQKIASKTNLFFVGDVKQSIYRFRLAEPQIFMDKYEKYKSDEDSIKIDLSANFRSDKQIIDFCNNIFEKIMTKSLSNIEYDDSARLKKVTYSEISEIKKENIKINFIVKEKEEEKISSSEKDDEADIDISELEDEEIMAEITARQINELVSDEKNNIDFKDIVILKRSLKNCISIYSKVFRKHKIPLFIDYSQAVFEVLEVAIFIDLLKIIDNIRQDEPLISILLSSIGNFSIEDITKIRIYDKEEKYFHKIFFKYSKLDDELAQKIRKFIDKIQYYSHMERYMRLDEYIDFLMKDTDYKNNVNSMPQGDMRVQNLEIINEKAREFVQNENKSLFYFLIYLKSILKNKSDETSPKMISKEQNLVRFMSIHKSKGLEFKVVILNDLQKKFNKQDKNKEIMLDSKYGIGADYIDEQMGYYTPSLAKKVVSLEYDKALRAEEIRILYVALTRAENRLILNSIAKNDYHKLMENIKSGFFSKKIQNIDNYKDLILYGISEDIQNNFVGVDLYEFCEINAKDFIEEKQENIDVEDEFEKLVRKMHLSEDERKDIKAKYQINYDYIKDIDKIVKNSVTSIAKKETNYIIEHMTDYERINIESEFSKAKIGTLNHIFLQNIDFKKDYTMLDLESKLEELVEFEFITLQEAKIINLKNIYDFINSDLGKRLKKAKKIYQEESFIMKYEDGILTGIVDLFFEEDEHIILIDYKTDGIKKEFAKQHSKIYENQINMYKDAIQKAFEKQVKESYIYFLSINQAVEM